MRESVIEWADEPPLAKRRAMLDLARQAVRAKPDNPQNWLALAKALLSEGELDELAESLASAIVRFPDQPEFHFHQALALEEMGDFESAIGAIGRVLALAPSHRAARLLQCKLRAKTASPGSAALTVGDEAFFETEREFIRVRIHALYRHGAFEQALHESAEGLARFPGDTAMTYFRGMTLAKLGRHGEARAVLMPDAHIDVSTLTPEGFEDVQKFCRELESEIARNRHFLRDPRGKSARESLLTRRVRDANAPVTEILLTAVKAHIGAYAARLDPLDDFARARPRRARLSSWAVVSEAEGHHISHHHPSGWLSGVFYVSAPMVGNKFSGALLLGALDGEAEDVRQAREIEPVPGRIVLFPSYVPHSTKPSGAPGTRTVVAFDVIASDG